MAKIKNEKSAVLSPRAAKTRKVAADTQKSPAKVAKMSVTKKTKGTSNPTPTHPTTPVMVQEAFSSLKSRKGHSLASIRNFIAGTYKLEVTKNKRIQTNIKKFISDEFEAGRIRMVNSEENKINYTSRFALVK